MARRQRQMCIRDRSTHDQQFAQTIANRIIEITPKGVIDRYMKFDEYMNDDKIKQLRNDMYELS